jgi:hexosaminidase
MKGIPGDCINQIFLNIDKKSGLGKEAYTLVIDDNITITASGEPGLFYGIQSLLQLMPVEVYGEQAAKIQSLKLPKVTINDQPRFEYRGLMVDVSRHFIPNRNS